MVKYHPFLPTKLVDKYLYYRGSKSRFYYEAYLNKMSYGEYIEYLNTQTKGDIEKLSFIPSEFHVHHKNENFYDNSIDNLCLINPSEHGRIHALDKHNNLRFIVITDRIDTIEEIGDMETYDVKCNFPYNNYIANGIVVHNSGKTTLALHAVAEEQKLNHRCAFIDMEHALDPFYAEALGVNLDNLLLAQPSSGEQALNIVEMLTRSGSVSLIVVDSVAALVPQCEIEKNIGESSMGKQAALMSQAMRILVGPVEQTKTAVIFINQIRMKFVMFGSPEVSSGGEALKYYASQRIDMRKIETISEGEDKVGNRVRAKVIKNKVGAPFREAQFNIRFGVGIDWAEEYLDLAETVGIIKKEKASYYQYKGENIGHGSDQTCQYLREHPEITSEIKVLLNTISLPEEKEKIEIEP
jgi:recombination protein RecA